MGDVVRTISVKLSMQIDSYFGNAEKAAGVTKVLSAEVETLGTKLETLGKASAPAAADLGKTTTAAGHLSDELGGVAAAAAPAAAGIEGATKASDGLAAGLDGVGESAKKKPFDPIKSGAGGAEDSVKKASFSLRGFGSELQTLSTKNKESFDKLTKAGLVAGGALVGAFGLMAYSAAGFDHEMSEVGSVADASGKQLQQLRVSAINAGQATVFSAGQAATAEAELAKAGESTATILSGGLAGSMALASAGSLDLAAAATDSATALNEFNLKGYQAMHVADVLSAGANKSATDVGQLSYSLNQAGLVAHQTGLSFEDTVGTLSAFAQAGLHGSDAGTSFKTMLQALQSPSKITQGLMDQLGISAYNAQGNFVGITNLAQNLHDSLVNLTQAQRDAALAQIFGSDAVRSADILYNQGAAGIQTWITNVNQTGAASDTAAAKLNNLSGDVENLKGSIETLTISSGEGAQGGLRSLTQAATRIVNSFAAMPSSVSTAGVALAAVVGVALLTGTAVTKLQAKSLALEATLAAMGPAGAKAAAGLSTVTSVATKTFVAFAAFEAISSVFGTTVSVPMSKAADDLANFGATGKATGDELNYLTDTINTLSSDSNKRLAQGIQGLFEATGLGSGIDDSITHDKQRLAAIDEGLAALVSNGHINDAANAFERLSEIARQNGVSLDQLSAGLPNYTNAMAGAADATKDATVAGIKWNFTGVKIGVALNQMIGDISALPAYYGVLATSTDETTAVTKTFIAGLDQENLTVDELKTSLDSLSGANEDYGKANSDALSSLADLTKGMKNHASAVKAGVNGLSTSNAVGRANLALVWATVDADKAQFTSAYSKNLQTEDQTDALKDASAQYDTYIGKLRTALLNEGYSSTAVDALIKQYAKIPPVASTEVDTPGLPVALNAVNDYWAGLKAVPHGVTTTVLAPGLTAATNGLSTLYTKLSNIDGKTVTVRVLEHYGIYTDTHTGIQHEAKGGVFTHAAVGLLSQASLYSPVDPGRYMIAEPQTGGEGFVPRYGDYQRSAGIIDTEARWYGGRFVPNYAMGSGKATLQGQSISTTYNVYPQRASFSTQDLAALTARHDAETRVGRRR